MFRNQKLRLVALAAVVGVTGCAATPPPVVPEAPDLAGAIQQAANADTAIVAFNQPAPCCSRQTLPEFLGIKGACNAVLGCANNIRNRLGLIYPGLEAKPPVLAITDPANLEPGAPAPVKAAAQIKAQEDQAAQKIKALRYLATIGCGGCYPDVEDAFIAGMKDCTEEVRYEAILAIRETTGVNCCFCSHGSCCSAKIQDELRKIAFDQSGCCTGEPSDRVRRQARLALAACGPPVIIEEPEEPEEVEPEVKDVETADEEDVETSEDDDAAEGDEGESEDGVDDAEDLPPPVVSTGPPVLNAAQLRRLPDVSMR